MADQANAETQSSAMPIAGRERSPEPEPPPAISLAGGDNIPNQSVYDAPSLAQSSSIHGSLSSQTQHIGVGGLDENGPERKSKKVSMAHLSRQYAKVTASWNEVRLLRDQAKKARQRLQRYQIAFRQSRRLYNDALDTMSIQYSSEQLGVNLNLLRSRVDHDRESVEIQVSECVSFERRLEEREVTLERRQTLFMTAAQDLMSMNNAASTDDFLAQIPSSKLATPSLPDSLLSFQIHPLLEQYYEKAGEVKIMGERLVDLDFAYHEAVAVRTLQEDQGQFMLISDNEFTTEYLRKRSMVEKELDMVIADADRLKKACDDAKLDVHAYQRRVPDSDQSSRAESPTINPDNAPPGLLPDFAALGISTEIIRASPSSEPYDKVRVTSRDPKVLDWMSTFDNLEPILDDVERLSGDLNMDSMRMMSSPASMPHRQSSETEKRRSESDLRTLAPAAGNRQDAIDDLQQAETLPPVTLP